VTPAPSIPDMFDEEACIARLECIRWPEGLRCLRCSGTRIRRIQAIGKSGKLRRLYWCLDCEYQYSSTVGTIFHDSHLPLYIWFLAIKMMLSAECNVSARKLEKDLRISYAAARNVAQRLRRALQEDRAFCINLISSLGEMSICLASSGASASGSGSRNGAPSIYSITR
jgi:transposase-like protein